MLKVNDGTIRLADGSLDLASGINKLTDGSKELSGKLGEASQDAKDMPTGKKQTDQFAEPVSVSEHKLADIPNYGTGMTPYFLSLSLYVGILMSTVILPLRDAADRVESGWNGTCPRCCCLLLLSCCRPCWSIRCCYTDLGCKYPMCLYSTAFPLR
ncbi:YhgE/Pip domain-containing protein [Cohnella kolymensis]|uniref:hypothetical protein n=1 Tax=Cohnella kolymensis TaxID=1590652 RepID=UPI000A58B6E8|nr:hypothetical protein [Cohnella kolymensis]